MQLGMIGLGRMGANLHANGSKLLVPFDMPDFRKRHFRLFLPR